MKTHVFLQKKRPNILKKKFLKHAQDSGFCRFSVFYVAIFTISV